MSLWINQKIKHYTMSVAITEILKCRNKRKVKLLYTTSKINQIINMFQTWMLLTTKKKSQLAKKITQCQIKIKMI